MKKKVILRSLGLLLVLAALLSTLPFTRAAYAQSNQQRRPFDVNDLFELEDVGRYFGGPYAFSSDGQKLAFTRVRPKKTLANYKWEFLWGNAGGDVWIHLSAGEPPLNITNGIEDGSGWWSPQWSPDGNKIAMLSTRGGNVRAWVYDMNTRRLKQLSPRAVAFRDVQERPLLWIDSEHLLYPVLPEGEQPVGMKIELQTPTIASAAWPKVTKGKETTASVLESGVPVHLENRPQGDLLLWDISGGRGKIILHGNMRSLQLSPDRKAVAFTRQLSVYLPKADQPLAFGTSNVATVAVAALDGTPININGAISQDVLEDSLRWSPDGNELAFLGYAGGHDQPPLLYRLDLRTKAVTAQSLKDLDVVPVVREASQIEWTAEGDLVLRAARRMGDLKTDVKTRRDWWLVTKDGSQKCLTEAIATPPREIWTQAGRQSFVGLTDGEIWRVEPASGKVENLTAKFEPKVVSISWPAKTNTGYDEYSGTNESYARMIFSVQDSDVLAPYVLDLSSLAITPLEKPTPKADLVDYSPATGTAIFYASDRNGLQVWRSDARQPHPTLLFGANGFLQNIEEGQFKSFEYNSLNGEKLRAYYIVPPGYEAGRRYPVLTRVYAGTVFGKRLSPFLANINSSSSLNLQIPAARGYVVLLPSMPLAPEGMADDPMLRLPEGVLPAVDKLIEMGVADPDRLFLMGQSFGGFSTYGLVTQTKRFKAAISLAGLSNLISLYAQFDARQRYTSNPHENLFQASLMESAQIHMGNPPWKDLGRYIRNSPIFYVDRVQTPIMIIQGDLDYVAMQQGEEFFTSLYRQGKRAKFVRYWGEGHVLSSPANIRDMWKQIFAWMEEFSPPASSPGQKPAVN